MTIHKCALCWAFVLIIRLRFPPGSSLTRDFSKLLQHSRLRRNVMAISHTSYPLFLSFLTGRLQSTTKHFLSTILSLLSRDIHSRFSFVRLEAIVSIVVGYVICRVYSFELNDVCRWVFLAIIRTQGRRYAWKCSWTFAINSEPFVKIKIDIF